MKRLEVARRYLALAALLLPLLWQQQARADDDAGQLVIINGTRSPELQPYRYMLSGLDAFDDHHELASNAAQVRFRLHKKGKAPADAFDSLTVRLLGNETDIPLPLADDHSFALPRNRAVPNQQYPDDALISLE
ncbi:hypothetical protein [Duganella callida]|uniref:hypothetical protein n=1 Tax=Duganella callida TaxID=2561932 RepID=UPI001E2B5EFF|nr:hypothetical protein [Duganella callida]